MTIWSWMVGNYLLNLYSTPGRRRQIPGTKTLKSEPSRWCSHDGPTIPKPAFLGCRKNIGPSIRAISGWLLRKIHENPHWPYPEVEPKKGQHVLHCLAIARTSFGLSQEKSKTQHLGCWDPSGKRSTFFLGSQKLSQVVPPVDGPCDGSVVKSV